MQTTSKITPESQAAAARVAFFQGKRADQQRMQAAIDAIILNAEPGSSVARHYKRRAERRLAWSRRYDRYLRGV